MAETRFRAVNRDLEAIGPAADALRDTLSGCLDEDGLACVELAVVEALTNAVVFGSSATGKPIDLFVEITERDVVVEIGDETQPDPGLFEGAGPERLDFDPSDRQGIPESGRGLSLMVVSMDEVGFRTVGDQVRLRLVRHRP
ncbi:MAG: ATP-binding protein [Tabrizicola sp.]|uniref:ATP-binding protein n=1 Tax=Tabrizicola sp. TaxID=2005166 RepID=UPI002AB8D62D|nr:ATP-binding protein [Tabrizicola sp.]MDZ4085884.1 ATP-binding protein [Tabrizicola sp.]